MEVRLNGIYIMFHLTSMRKAINKEFVDQAKNFLSQGDVSAAWEALSQGGDNYAGSASKITDPNGSSFSKTLVMETWENTVGIDVFNEKFNSVAENHLSNYIEAIENSQYQLPSTSQIENSYYQALVNNGVSPNAAVDFILNTFSDDSVSVNIPGGKEINISLKDWPKWLDLFDGKWSDDYDIDPSRIDPPNVQSDYSNFEAIWKSIQIGVESIWTAGKDYVENFLESINPFGPLEELLDSIESQIDEIDDGSISTNEKGEILPTTPEDDRLIGTAGYDGATSSAGNDYIDGLGSNDNLFGGQGNDTVLGGTGNDYIGGGEGNDFIDGGIGNDRIVGEDGNDKMLGGDGSDTIDGGLGNDIVYGGNGDDWIDSGLGNNIVYGGEGDDDISGIGTLLGEEGNDRVSGFGENDYIVGGEGNDTLSSTNNSAILGGGGDDYIVAGKGNDTLSGGDNNDIVSGGDGNDFISGGDGQDTLSGGNGADTYLLDSFKEVDTIYMNPSEGDEIIISSLLVPSIDSLSYNESTGSLFFEENQFAILENMPTIDLNSDIQIV